MLSVGDTTMDIFFRVSEADVKCKKEKDHCDICFGYGDKIAAQEMRYEMGGNAANFASGVNKLGMRTALWTILGDDQMGSLMQKQLEDIGIDGKYIRKIKGGKNNTSAIVSFKQERTIFSYHAKKNYLWPKPSSAQWMYFTSMSEGFEKCVSDILKYVKEGKVRLVFAPGTYQRKKGLDVLKSVLQASEVYISNKEEAADLFSVPYNEKKRIDFFKHVIARIHDAGSKKVVITDGVRGLYASDGEYLYYLRAFPSDIVERTGAGDGFSAGFVAGLFHGKPINEALAWGVINASSIVTKVGAQNGQLDMAEMEKRMKDNPKFRAVVVTDEEFKTAAK